MFRVRTTIVSPTATTITIATSVAMSRQLARVAKFVAWIEKSRTTNASAAKIPISRNRKAAATSACGENAFVADFMRPPPARRPRR